MHGVRDEFLAVGHARAAAAAASAGGAAGGRGVYFLGKKLWAKGYRELVDLLASAPVAEAAAGGGFGPAGLSVDLVGSGPDEAAIEAAWAAAAAAAGDGASARARAGAGRPGLPALRFLGALDHAAPATHAYHLFVNPSTSDVLCTATAEALAMGKLVLIADHPSNAFFVDGFANCRTFPPGDAAAFAKALTAAAAATPQPLTAGEMEALSWAAATDRLVAALRLPLPAAVGSEAAAAAAEAAFALGGSAAAEGSPSAAAESSPSAAAAAAVGRGRAWRRSRSVAAELCFALHQCLGSGPLGVLLRDLTGADHEADPEAGPAVEAWLRTTAAAAAPALGPGSFATVRSPRPVRWIRRGREGERER